MASDDFHTSFVQLVPEEHQADVLYLLERVIRTVHQASPDRWGVRVSDRGTVMVLIGMHEVLQVLDWGVHFIFDAATVDQELRTDERYSFSGMFDEDGQRVGAGVYKSNPGTESCNVEFEEAKALFVSQAHSFQVMVDRAARTRTHPSTRKTHSVGFVRFLSDKIGRALPQPGHANLVPDASFKASDQPLADAGRERSSKPSAEPLSEPSLAPDAVVVESSDGPLTEGEIRTYLATRAERNPEARRRCLQAHGYRCSVCDQHLEEIYGPLARGLIEVHHLKPFAEGRGERVVDPVQDLRPVCPNCHAVIHSKVPAYSISELRSWLHGRVKSTD
jgi:hypothetical protein